jgi:hypothetical protein
MLVNIVTMIVVGAFMAGALMVAVRLEFLQGGTGFIAGGICCGGIDFVAGRMTTDLMEENLYWFIGFLAFLVVVLLMIWWDGGGGRRLKRKSSEALDKLVERYRAATIPAG